MDQRLLSSTFPRASTYHPEWVIEAASGGANALWLIEWLASAMELRPGMRVLDLGCGRASSSIFLRREFGVQVWATDLWISAAENAKRIAGAGITDGVVPIHADARALPFEPEFFDAVVSIDAFPYFGTDDLYLNYLARFVKPGGQMGIADAGLIHEIEGPVPEHLRAWWEPSMWCLHSAPWWRRHWEKTGIVTVEVAIRCLMAGATGWSGSGRWLRRTRRKSSRWNPTPVEPSATSVWSAAADRVCSSTSRSSPSLNGTTRSRFYGQLIEGERTHGVRFEHSGQGLALNTD